MNQVPDGAIELVDLTVDGFRVVRMHTAVMDLTRDPGRWLAAHIAPGPYGAFVAIPDRRTLLAHPIHDRSALGAVAALADEAQREGSAPEIHHWYDGALTRLALVERSGRTYLDPRDVNTIDRIESLPPVALSLEEEALGGSERAAAVLAARAWERGAAAEADRWYAHLREGFPTAALSVAWVIVEEHLEATDDRPVDDAARAADFAAAARWLQRCAARADHVARMVCDVVELGSGDLVLRWAWAITDVARALNRTVQQAAPDRIVLFLGPAELGLDDVEDILAVLREHGGEPAVTTIDRGHRNRVVDLAAQSAPALRELYLESMDEDVSVALGPRNSWVSGPAAAAERVRQITEARRRARVAFGEPALWARALLRGGMYMLAIPAGWLLATADGEYERAVTPYFIALEVAIGIFLSYRLLTQPRRDERAWRRGTLRAGGPVRIRREPRVTRT